ncbi:MAG: protein-L-isoaspartate(D-aspartate) O-methyltransferase [Patescibacteria group bacterium]|nr:protein-L-isoaspartate(D-aspartate) O-methyltransferase [Patescibacteria group bacterium]
MNKREFIDLREKMVESQLEARGISDVRVLEAFRNVPREKFVPEHLQDLVYLDSPLSIGEGQTISQPYTVAFMTELLELEPESKLLEIGTGSGYQAAILAEIVSEVYTIERLESLAREAEETLKELGYTNVYVKVGDGSEGWLEEAPFDRILVTAAATEIPEALFDQLSDEGILVAPVGSSFSQDMVRFTKVGNRLEKESFGKFRFVPLIEE